ncbi:MAG TPA: hypothetical protein VMW72_24255 [Sedimentisphaerales bacterium]|nr:hypothetical protein [Sedimentisphaerales bacterium]
MKINPIGHLVKTNPIQTQSNPIAKRVKLMQSVYLQRVIKENAAKSYEKTKPKQTQFKPKQTQFQMQMLPCTNNAMCYT